MLWICSQAKGVGQSVLPALCARQAFACDVFSTRDRTLQRHGCCVDAGPATPTLLSPFVRRAAAVPPDWDDERIGRVQERYVREKADEEFRAPGE